MRPRRPGAEGEDGREAGRFNDQSENVMEGQDPNAPSANSGHQAQGPHHHAPQMRAKLGEEQRREVAEDGQAHQPRRHARR